MASSTSYRLTPDLRQRLARRASTEGITVTALITRLLEQGLAAIAHPGIVYRPGPAEHLDEIEARMRQNEEAAERVRDLAAARASLLGQ